MELMEARGIYLSSLEQDKREEAQQAISKFIRWWGRGGSLEKLTPPELGDYAEMLSAIGTPEAQRGLEALKDFLSFAKKKGIVKTNLALHIKAAKRTSSRKPKFQGTQEIPQEAKLTSQGYAELQDRLTQFRSQQIRVAQDIRHAAADKDVRENAPLEAAREEMGRIVSQASEIEAVLNRAVIIGANQISGAQQPGLGLPKISEGSKVTLKDLGTGEELKYLLVHPSEASALENRISTVSPVGKALLNHTPGEEIKITAPRGTLRYFIVDVG